MQLSLCITTYNRYSLTIESFAQVLDDDRISEIVIMDDCSFDGSFKKLNKYFAGNDKVRILQNMHNLGMSLNKREAINAAKNEWCILFDSDNVIGKDYLDAFYEFADPDFEDGFAITSAKGKVIFCPDFAKPKFDYTKYSNNNHPSLGIFDAEEAKRYIHEDEFNCLMNTCNYIVNREFYLSVYKHNPHHIASDTIWHNYNHLKAGGEFTVVQKMQYFHRVHPGSGFMQDADYNMKQAAEVRKLIQQL